MASDLPTDADLIKMAGWADVPTARVLTKDGSDRFCVALVDSNGGLGGPQYVTAEFFDRDTNGAWQSAGDIGPAGGTGWHGGHVYACGQSSDRALVTVDHGGSRHERPVSVEGWWIYVAPQDGIDPAPQLELPSKTRRDIFANIARARKTPWSDSDQLGVRLRSLVAREPERSDIDLRDHATARRLSDVPPELVSLVSDISEWLVVFNQEARSHGRSFATDCSAALVSSDIRYSVGIWFTRRDGGERCVWLWPMHTTHEWIAGPDVQDDIDYELHEMTIEFYEKAHSLDFRFLENSAGLAAFLVD